MIGSVSGSAAGGSVAAGVIVGISTQARAARVSASRTSRRRVLLWGCIGFFPLWLAVM